MQRYLGAWCDVLSPLLWAFKSLYNCRKSLVQISGWKATHFQWVVDTARTVLSHRFCLYLLLTEVLCAAKRWRASSFVRLWLHICIYLFIFFYSLSDFAVSLSSHYLRSHLTREDLQCALGQFTVWKRTRTKSDVMVLSQKKSDLGMILGIGCCWSVEESP